MKRLAFLFALAACGPDETVSAYGQGDDYVLQEMNGAVVSVPITLNISDTGQISGQAPCNRYSADQSAPYPWFALGPIISTRAACPDLALEHAYLGLLARMSIVEVSGPVMILSNDADETLVFQVP